MNCPHCGFGPLPEQAVACPACNKKLAPEARAGTEIRAELKIERMESGQATAVQVGRAEGPLTIYTDSVQIPGITRPHPVSLPELLKKGLPLEPGRWTRLLGPFVGNVMALAVDPFDPKRVFAGMRDGWYAGLYRSRDGGLSWELLTPGPGDPHIHALGISPHTGAVYAGTGDGVFVSRDGGETWQLEHERYRKMEIRCIAFSAQDPYFYYFGSGKYSSGTFAYAGSAAGAVRGGEAARLLKEVDDPAAGGGHFTLDGGKTWKTLAGIRNVNAAAVPDADSTLLYQGTSDHGLYRRESGLDRNFKLGVAQHIYGLAVSPADPLHLLAGSERGNLQSFDGGESWETVEAAGIGQSAAVLFSSEDGQHILAGSPQGVIESRDGGRTWNPSDRGLVHRRVVSFARGPDGSLYAGTDGGGVYRRGPRQVSWIESSLGLSDRIQGLALLVFGDQHLLLGANTGLYRSENGGLTWRAVTNFNMQLVTALAMPGEPPALVEGPALGGHTSMDGGLTWQAAGPAQVPSLLIAATQSPSGSGSFIYSSHDGGYTWEQRAEVRQGKIWSLAISSRSARLAFAAAQWGGLLRSQDGGLTWRPVDELAKKAAVVVQISPHTPQRVYVGTAKEGLFASADYGETWQPLGPGLPEAPILSLACSPHDPALLLCGCQDGGVYRSSDGGGTWQLCGLPEHKVHALTASARIPNLVLAGTDQGAYLSKDAGESWHAYLDGLAEEALSIRCLAFSPQEPRLVFAGCFIGAYKTTIPGG